LILPSSEWIYNLQQNQIVAALRVGYGQFGVALRAISGFWQHLSSASRVWQSVESQELDPFANVMGDGCNAVGGLSTAEYPCWSSPHFGPFSIIPDEGVGEDDWSCHGLVPVSLEQ